MECMEATEYFKNLDITYNPKALILEHKKTEYKPYSSGRNDGTFFDYAPTWLQGRVRNLDGYPEIKRITEYLSYSILSQNIKPRFYKQEANTEVPMHSDLNTKCCVNIVLSEFAAPIIFEDLGPIEYSCALLNITKRHMVPAYPTERLLLKFSIFDVDYEEAFDSLN